MKKLIFLVIILLIYSCHTSKIYKEYSLYRRDKEIYYPEAHLTIKFEGDSTGLFINNAKNKEVFTQQFVFSKENNFIIIEDLDQTNPNVISLSLGDTIIAYNKRLHFFYEGEKKYFLSFKPRLRSYFSH